MDEKTAQFDVKTHILVAKQSIVNLIDNIVNKHLPM
jgi:hypothetical protein